MGPSVLLLLLLTSELTMIHGGLVQLYRMVPEVTSKKAVPYYSSYGCHCGLGGRGRPKDTTDRCCQRHDCCYHQLQKRRCRPQITCYPYSYRWGEIQCERREKRTLTDPSQSFPAGSPTGSSHLSPWGPLSSMYGSLLLQAAVPTGANRRAAAVTGHWHCV